MLSATIALIVCRAGQGSQKRPVSHQKTFWMPRRPGDHLGVDDEAGHVAAEGQIHGQRRSPHEKCQNTRKAIDLGRHLSRRLPAHVPRDDNRPLLSEALVGRLYRQSGAARWTLPIDRFAAALEARAGKALAGTAAGPRDLERYTAALHLEDLALACACADGHTAAWDHFVAQHRPVLYRAADALDPTGGAREIADSLYAELYGLKERHGERRSLFAYYHGRSSLATWLRAILAQRQVDRVRAGRRLEPLEDDPPVATAAAPAPDPDRPRYLALVRRTLRDVLSDLAARDRLRLALYYAQELTLAQIGRLLGEHEATVSRQLAKARREIRTQVERHLRTAGLDDGEIAACFEYAAHDGDALELGEMLSVAAEGKNPRANRST